jgi:hypothetical protein
MTTTRPRTAVHLGLSYDSASFTLFVDFSQESTVLIRVTNAYVLQSAVAARCKSVMGNSSLAKGYVDSAFEAATPAWMDTYGHQLVAQLLYEKIFKVPDWYLKELRVRFCSLAYFQKIFFTSVICFCYLCTNFSLVQLSTRCHPSLLSVSCRCFLWYTWLGPLDNKSCCLVAPHASAHCLKHCCGLHSAVQAASSLLVS